MRRRERSSGFGMDDEPTTERPRPPANDPGGTLTGRDLHKAGIIELPKDKRFSLAVIQGAATGQIFAITKTRTTIGRAGQDVNLDDPEASRQHAVLEVLGETAILRDLDSTNGTFVDLERIQQQVLGNQMEFRIGSHVLQRRLDVERHNVRSVDSHHGVDVHRANCLDRCVDAASNVGFVRTHLTSWMPRRSLHESKTATRGATG